MDKNNKGYIVTKIEKYEEMYEEMYEDKTKFKLIIDDICIIIFAILYRITIPISLIENLDMIVNQIIDDVSMFGIGIAVSNNLIIGTKHLYSCIMSKIWNDKLQKNNEKSQIDNLIIENKGGRTI